MVLRGLFRRKRKEQRGRALIIFQEVSQAIKAEKVLKEAGYEIRMVAPPPHFRKGCDLSVEFDLMEQLGVERALRQGGCEYLEVIPVSEEALQPLEICQRRDFGRWEMIKAANMKITYDKETYQIVNVSGGGCPDVPYLAWQMVGRKLHDAPSPKDLGHTVCAYALWRAWEEAKKGVGR